MNVRIALDAMGGDFLAVPNLQGAFSAIKRSLDEGKNLKVYLVGPKERVLGSLQEAIDDPGVDEDYKIDRNQFEKFLNEGLLELVDCTQVVDMDESPGVVVRSKRDSSMGKSFQLVRDGKADAMISAGNSGAVMAYGIANLGRISEVRRPAILCHFPSKSGVTALLDAGANVDCTSEQLFQFAVMGQIYFQSVFEKKDVKVALLNIGEEEGKGNEAVKATAALLKEKMPESYFGFVEGRDIMKGKVDVIVCDGFVGNVVLKTAEGVAQVVKETLKEEFSRNPIWGLGAWLAKGGFMAMKTKLDYREYGAAPLIGLNGLGLVAHGSSDGKAITNAIRIAERYVQNGLIEKLQKAFGDKTEAAALVAEVVGEG
ncbi:MAG: phosphate acyltransferase PlsX [Deltaproteobacteria bacterium]|nr:phosphate acyltransferase PlsX [Deltaproteobacteria bacterium]